MNLIILYISGPYGQGSFSFSVTLHGTWIQWLIQKESLYKTRGKKIDVVRLEGEIAKLHRHGIVHVYTYTHTYTCLKIKFEENV